MNITVRVDGTINNVLSAHEFIKIVEQIFGEGKSIEEYITLYNNADRSKNSGIVVHIETNEGSYV